MKPTEIILEVTNLCNLRCRFCHIHGEGSNFSRPKGIMLKEIWQKVLDEISSWEETVSLVTHGAGEPLLYPHIKELLRESTSKENLIVGFMTNGMLLKANIADFLIETKVDWIALSIDGTDPVSHDAIRRGANLSVIEGNLSYLIERKEQLGQRRPLLRFNMVLYPHIKEQKQEYLERWLPHAHSITFSRFRPVGKRLLWEDEDPQPQFIPCPHLFNQAVISWDGQLALCCEDIELEVSPGSIINSTLEEIFTSSATYQHYRNSHLAQKTDQLKLCAQCHVWASGIIIKKEELEIFGKKVLMTETYSGQTYTVIE